MSNAATSAGHAAISAVARALPLGKTGMERVEGPDARWDRMASSTATSLSYILLIFLNDFG
jgi:hypothetical protein